MRPSDLVGDERHDNGLRSRLFVQLLPASLAPLREASAVALAAALARFAVLLQSPERLLDVVGDFIDSATNETARDSRRR